MGIDTKAAAVQLARGSVQSLIRADADYARQAAPMRFHTHNVFMPSLRHKVTRGLPAASEVAYQSKAATFASRSKLHCALSLRSLTLYRDGASQDSLAAAVELQQALLVGYTFTSHSPPASLVELYTLAGAPPWCGAHAEYPRLTYWQQDSFRKKPT